MKQGRFGKQYLGDRFIDILCEYFPDDVPSKTLDELSEKLVSEVEEHLNANIDDFVKVVIE